MIPNYRRQEIVRIYQVFKSNTVDLKKRSVEFKKILRSYYKWADDKELHEMFEVVRRHHLEASLSVELFRHCHVLLFQVSLFSRWQVIWKH